MRALKVPGYLRYVADMFFFGYSQAELRAWRRQVGDWLMERRGLRLKVPRASVLSCRGHLDGLGYRIRREGRQPLPRVFRRMESRVREAVTAMVNRPPAVDLERSMAACAGVVLF